MDFKYWKLLAMKVINMETLQVGDIDPNNLQSNNKAQLLELYQGAMFAHAMICVSLALLLIPTFDRVQSRNVQSSLRGRLLQFTSCALSAFFQLQPLK